MQQPWWTWHSTVMMRHWVMVTATDKVRTGAQQAASLHQRNTAEGETGMTEICVTSSAAEMHVTG
jgi:hypothetical protein